MTPIAERAHKAAMQIGYNAPFLLPALAQVEFIESTEVPTMGVNDNAVIAINPEFAKTLAPRVLGGCVAHELLHLMLAHTQRQNGRDVKRWNLACDMAINQVLRDSGIALPSFAVYPPYHHQNKTAEELYELLKQENQEQPEPQPQQVSAGCGVGKGKGESKEGDQPGEGFERTDGQAPTPQEWKEALANARELARGTESGKAFARLCEIPPPKANYAHVLRSCISRALAQHGRDDQSYTKRSRRSPEDIILPGWIANKARGAVIIDASGSMSDPMLAQCCAETVEINKQISQVKLFLAIHDVDVQWHGWIHAKNAVDVHGRVRGRGGTDFDRAYRLVEKQAGRLDFVIHLTDGEIFGNWPQPPRNARKFVAAVLGNGGDTPPLGSLKIAVEI